MRGEKKGFTLVELLVVISVIALLLAILMPALHKARKLGQAAVCKAHLRQWGTVFFMYTTDNDDKFWIEPNVWATGVKQGGWMPYLSSLYGNVDEFRLCPSAAKPNTKDGGVASDGSIGGIGTTFKQWGPGKIMENHSFGPDPTKNYGSYGINLWINSIDPPGTPPDKAVSPKGWRGAPKRQWQRLQSKHTDKIPMVFDCTWFGTNPITDNDETNYGTNWPNGSSPTESEDWWEQKNSVEPSYWDWDMARVCINRHSRGINMTFMDLSARKVLLEDLWTLKWHTESKPDYVPIPWLK